MHSHKLHNHKPCIASLLLSRTVSVAVALVALAGMLGGAPPVAAQNDFTLAEVLSTPFPSELVSAPAGDRVAWVQNNEGIRNVWVAASPAYDARQVTHYTLPEQGQSISDLAFTPDGKYIVYTRGGASNREGWHANPTSNPAGMEPAVWIAPITGGAPKKLARGHSPVVSPGGEQVAYQYQGEVWSVTLDDGAPSDEPEQLIQARGSLGHLRWSPSGGRLAFVSDRNEHSFIGLYDVAADTLTYLDPSVDRDIAPVWSPDGTRIAWIRIPANIGKLPHFTPQRRALPWSIHVFNFETDEPREAWRAKPGVGSAFWGIEAENQLLWGAEGRLIFPWERSGWVHLYSVPVSGGEATELTPGNFIVEHVTLTPDRRTLVYSSNQENIDQRHLWDVPVGGSALPEPVTSGDGIEWSPVVTTEGHVAFLASGATTPAHVKVLLNDERQRPVTEAPPETFPGEALVVPEKVVFPSAEGFQIHGQLFLPPDLELGEKRPALLFFHGGSRRQMLLGFHYMHYYHNDYAMNQYLANHGYIVLSVNYRSGIGYGMRFREALRYGAFGASEYQDVLAAARYLKGRRDVDSSRIGLWGGSYGGYLTALGLARDSDLFAAGVDLHGVDNWNVTIENFVPDYQPERRPELARTAYLASPMADVENWRSPVLLIHGDDDRNVPFTSSVCLAGALRRRGVHVETLVFPDEVHGFLLHANWLAAYRTAADFFDRMLKQNQAAEVDQAGGVAVEPVVTGPAESQPYLQLFERRCDGK